jgi:predicted amidophosphoribosyltransferase
MNYLLPFHYLVTIWFYNCRDCGDPLPTDMREIGFCKACWRPFTSRHDDSKTNRLTLEQMKKDREAA